MAHCIKSEISTAAAKATSPGNTLDAFMIVVIFVFSLFSVCFYYLLLSHLCVILIQRYAKNEHQIRNRIARLSSMQFRVIALSLCLWSSNAGTNKAIVSMHLRVFFHSKNCSRARFEIMERGKIFAFDALKVHFGRSLAIQFDR